MTSAPRQIAIVGAGPRGLSVLERLCANSRTESTVPLIVHVVDPAEPGAGAVWRTGQSRHLLMNTVASQVTVFTDRSVTIDGPIEPGPSLYDWAHGAASSSGRDTGSGTGADHDEETVTEARALGPDSYPTRALYGRYLCDAFQHTVNTAPTHITVRVHRSRALSLTEDGPSTGGLQSLRLEDGTRLTRLDAVILAQGHVPAFLTPAQQQLADQAAEHGLSYLPPANPADVDLSRIEPGQPVLLRGLGLNFFDHVALLTAGRGGTFHRRDGRLVYESCGREPLLYATSRRGIPYQARGANEKGAYGRHTPRLLTAEVIAGLRARGRHGARVHFGTDLWPLISKEVRSVYYEALLTARGREADRPAFTEKFLSAGEDAEASLLDSLDIESTVRWDWEKVARPYVGRTFADRADFRDWLLEYLAWDIREARDGNVTSPLKAALDVLRDLRNEIRLAVDHGGLDGTSHRDELAGWYTPLNAYLSIGPPLSRVEEMKALMEAGTLHLIGPGTRIRVDEGEGSAAFPASSADPAHLAAPAFVAESETVPGPPVRARVLIEARLPEPDLLRTADPLLRQLLSVGQCVPYRIEGGCGHVHQTGGLAVAERPYRLLDAQGRAHPRRFAYGVPTESVHWVTAAGIRPGVDSVTLGDSDAIARTVLALLPLAASAVEPAAPVVPLPTKVDA
ncbi:FAD/NAD(P)-binding protein [Streptomyces sp. NPDC059443]|uniref:FAD/NAD(P)-binding protein n=1 Tax=unclassified Streptomyces TaxID=2593676 RepID=UPI0036A66C1C